MIGLFIGRFQPLHLGHADAIERALKEVDTLIIGIGSSEKFGTAENPFTFAEREQMIKKVFPKCKVVAIPDIDDDSKWVAHVRKIAGKFDIVFSGNPNTIKLFEAAGYKVKVVKFKKKISATTIRNLIAKGDASWKTMVPAGVARLICEIRSS
jgi:nicotinamide-nucleotide adenylyltransferase